MGGKSIFTSRQGKSSSILFRILFCILFYILFRILFCILFYILFHILFCILFCVLFQILVYILLNILFHILVHIHQFIFLIQDIPCYSKFFHVFPSLTL